MENNIYIIGAGAIGKSLAVFLKLAHKNVTLIRGSVDDHSSYTAHIRVMQDNAVMLEADVPVSTLSNFAELDGIIVLTNKSYGNENLAMALKGKTGISPVILLQNGLDVEQPFANNNFPEIYRCVLFVTSQALSGSDVRFKPVAPCPIGVINSKGMHLNDVVEQLSTVHFKFKTENDIQPIIWKKAIANSVFNSVCPLLNIDNGIFHRNEDALAIAKRIAAECIIIANAKGIKLHHDEVLDSILSISRSSDGQSISTLQDINNKRRTEIETLNFAIVDIAKVLGKEDVVKETRLLGELTRLKSDLNR